MLQNKYATLILTIATQSLRNRRAITALTTAQSLPYRLKTASQFLLNNSAIAPLLCFHFRTKEKKLRG
jgi:hypothetical protein